MPPEAFEIVGDIRAPQRIASGHGIRDLPALEKRFGRGNWRKMKGSRPFDSTMVITEAEIHWYEAHGIGKRWLKIKRYLD